MKKFCILVFTLMVIFGYTFEAEAATYTDIIARVREYIYEPTAANSIFSDTVITEAIIQGEQYLSDALPLSANTNLNTESVILCTPGVSTYSLPATSTIEFRKIIALQYCGVPAIQVKLEEYYSKPTKPVLGKDSYFTIINDKIKVWPAPTSATQSIELVYQFRTNPTYSSASYPVAIKDEYKYMLVLAACRYLMYVDGQTVRGDSITKELNGELQAIYDGLNNSNIVERIKNAK